jgi:hypothetical protein
MPEYAEMTLRPYRLLCAVCSLGGEQDGQAEELLAAVRNSPDMPITLRCNAGDAFVYQDSGTADDTPEGAEFNVRRDLEILHKLNLFPGCTLPARILFNRLLAQIDGVAGICGYGEQNFSAWQGCPRAGSGNYERGCAKGIDAIIPPRGEQEMAREKAASLDAMYSAEAIPVRPHILLCAVCQYGGGLRPPYPEDNLPELIELILREPETRITLAPYADWAMCAPCPYRAAGLNACVNNRGSGGLPNQMRDLRVLQKLGLTYGSTLPARELYRLIFTRISGTLEICRLEHLHPSVWYTGCGEAATDSEDYQRGRKLLSDGLGCVRV